MRSYNESRVPISIIRVLEAACDHIISNHRCASRNPFALSLDIGWPFQSVRGLHLPQLLSFFKTILILSSFFCKQKQTLRNDDGHGNTLRITGPLWGNPPLTDGFSSQKASNVELRRYPCSYLNKILNKQSNSRWFDRTLASLFWYKPNA